MKQDFLTTPRNLLPKQRAVSVNQCFIHVHPWLCLVSMFIFAGLLLAETQAAEPAEKTMPKLQVRLIRATNGPVEEPDSRLKPLGAQLKVDFGYSNYQQAFLLETYFVQDEEAVFEMPDGFGITITYHGTKNGKREFFVETEFRGKKFAGFDAAFPDKALPMLIRGPGTKDFRYIIALSSI